MLLHCLPEVPIYVVPGDEQNLEVTYPVDLFLADKPFQLSSYRAAPATPEQHAEPWRWRAPRPAGHADAAAGVREGARGQSAGELVVASTAPNALVSSLTGQVLDVRRTPYQAPQDRAGRLSVSSTRC